MKYRSVAAVILLSIITLGFYAWYWLVRTKTEMNLMGASIPTAWLLIIPIVNWYWLWKFSEGVEKVTEGKLTTPIAFILQFFLSVIGYGVVQHSLNQVVKSHYAGTTPVAPATPPATPPAAPAA